MATDTQATGKPVKRVLTLKQCEELTQARVALWEEGLLADRENGRIALRLEREFQKRLKLETIS